MSVLCLRIHQISAKNKGAYNAPPDSEAGFKGPHQDRTGVEERLQGRQRGKERKRGEGSGRKGEGIEERGNSVLVVGG